MKITSEEALREIYGFPKELAQRKQLQRLEKHTIKFIRHAPFVALSTSDGQSSIDCSPRGGAPGFVKVLNETTLLIPDVKGNNRLDSLANIIAYPRVGCLFLIPGMNETLRINGSAELRTDPDLLDAFPTEKKRPLCVIKLNIEEVFLHCAKALIRSSLWSDEDKIERSTFPTLGQMLQDQISGALVKSVKTTDSFS